MPAQYTPSTGPGAGTPLAFHLLIDPPERETRQVMSERVIPGSTNAVIDIVGKTVTKIRGQARFDSFGGFKTFEGVVGTQGSLIYSEEPTGVSVIFVSMVRNRVTKYDVHIAQVEFWIVPPTGTVVLTRNVAASATVPSGAISNILSAQVSYGFDQRTGQCRLVTALKPNCSYDDQLTVTMGAGSNNVVRFVGLVRDFQYQNNPTSVTTIASGYLIRAIEYENHE